MSDILGRFKVHVLVVVMFLLPAISLFLSRGKPGRGVLDSLMIQVMSVAQTGGSVGLGYFDQLWQDYVDLRGLREENERLRQQVARFEEERARLIGVLQENARLRQMVEFKESRTDLKLRPARVIGRDVTPYFRVLRVKLDIREVNSPIRPQMAVVTYEGIVGQVVEVYDDNFAEIMLVSDPRSKIDVISQRNRTRGLIHGLGHRKDYEARLAHLRRKDEVAEGDQIVTSGKAGVFPQELLVGKVTSVEKRPWGLDQKAIVEPTVDFGRLEEVFIVTGEYAAGVRP